MVVPTVILRAASAYDLEAFLVFEGTVPHCLIVVRWLHVTLSTRNLDMGSPLAAAKAIQEADLLIIGGKFSSFTQQPAWIQYFQGE